MPENNDYKELINTGGKFLLEGLGGSIADAAKATAAQLLENLVETSVSYVSQVLAEEIGKNKEGVVLQGIQIQNLNINLTAEVVQQLNMNPNEVKNIFGEQIKEATVKAIVQKLSDI